MAQAEDTELRDLVIEALEKNGSLAKIRALLRANIFLAFEDECEHMKQNINLDNVLKIPEGVLALTIVHEFLEFCNLKNTLFVYMSESRQGTEYTYDGRKVLADQLHLLNGNHDLKEPILVTFVKNILRPYQRKYYEKGDAGNVDNHVVAIGNVLKDDQNCTYIVQDDTSTSTSNSTSDNSSDEKNKLQLKLTLDNSDTDTSSDSVREKMSSEYIPNQHILSQARVEVDKFSLDQHSTTYGRQGDILSSQHSGDQLISGKNHIHEVKTNFNNSSESTSYIDIKSYKPPEQQNVPTIKVDDIGNTPVTQNAKDMSSDPPDIKVKMDSVSSTMNSITSLSLKHDSVDAKSNRLCNTNECEKSDTEATEYSLDFSLSPVPKKNLPENQLQSPDPLPANASLKEKSSPLSSPAQNSQSSQSSVSISDVADLIEYSDKNFSLEQTSSKENVSGISPTKPANRSKSMESDQNVPPSEDSGDFSESPIPSLSNLSLDVHSD